MGTPGKPWKAEYAKSSCALCRTCKNRITKELLRFGKMVQSSKFDGQVHMWNHDTCILKTANQIKSLDDVEGIYSLRWEDQEMIRKYIEGGVSSSNITTVAANVGGIEVSQIPGATCRRCSQKIMKGEVRISTKPEGQGARGVAWHHASCFMESTPSTKVEKLSGWESLSASDQEAVCSLAKKGCSTNKSDLNSEAHVDDELMEKPSKGGMKRRRSTSDGQKSKVHKSEENVLVGDVPNTSDLKSKLEDQSKTLWAIQDELKKHVTMTELRAMLKANHSYLKGSEFELRDRCADGMLFGALDRCPICNGPIICSGDQYCCRRHLKWGRCSYSATEASRLKGKWKVPQETSNEYLTKWFELQKGNKPTRILPPHSSKKASGSQVTNGVSNMLKSKKLEDLKVTITGLPKESNGMATVKFKGRGAVDESSGLQDSGHILEDGKSIYTTTLNMSDLVTSINSYYILQIIQDDKGSDCHVFRKWGRVGSETIGGTKLEEMAKSDAIQEFRRLFLEKSGNPWEAWEQNKNFVKHPGKFFPLDIDYGVDKQVTNNVTSLLDPQLVELMKMLFNVETYRSAMLEFEINMSEMPLGKLSKSNIQKGFEALTEIQIVLASNHDHLMKKSLLMNASNQFFTLIPSLHPHVISDEDDIKSKLNMLEALRDIEIASRLVGFYADSDDSFDENYKKLRCAITPLPRDSEDFQLVKNYFHATDAHSHKDWALELEDVFTLEREGEFDQFAPYREKLQNKMLLWHGSRLTNFVGILSQGLRIAPPEAPTTGYKFGKGVYFADMVSKSAHYCYTDKKNPVGLMLLSEVALGKVYELNKDSYMDKPPQGMHSTKGLGKMIPQPSEYVKWRDDVVVPCGKPVSSGVMASQLYNQYIVYDTAQVKMQFLLKVRFPHKADIRHLDNTSVHVNIVLGNGN
ncbi:hypothetical protein IFM89_006052 [Coptis chinensis]|uniref:Poly [ADP-ribose] polymerase n=1 Tax=Coptis chinensis TaxID=261450 RepID=A0A835LUN1_9MAGN|nr:hypothetical protein IFM89_006052 [Coptis chinensis]